MPEEENGNENSLLTFVKGLLGFYGDGVDFLIGPLVISAEQYLKNAGVVKPVLPEDPSEEEQAAFDAEESLYNLAVAVRVKILHDGDPKGDLERSLVGIILQTKDYGIPGGEEEDG